MPTESQELKDHLRQTDQEFRQLADKHHELDSRLTELSSKHYLSAAVEGPHGRHHAAISRPRVQLSAAVRAGTRSAELMFLEIGRGLLISCDPYSLVSKIS
jgi:hypothetical protein